MSKRGYIWRYHIIINKLTIKPYSTYEEIQSYIENQFLYSQMQDDDLEVGFSKRTLQRDLKEIRNLFGVDIEYSRANKGYFINQDEMSNANFQRRMEAFDIFNSLQITQELESYIHLEKRKPQGTENLFGLLHSIKKRFQIKFTYHKFWEEKSTFRNVEPYALKEFKNRWYVLARDLKDNQIKSFALDRLSNLEITRLQFQFPDNFNVNKYYQNFFGVISPNDIEPENIILSFTPFQGKYVKTLPLHESQQLLADNEKEVRIQLKLCITYDFILELLSLGSEMKVIESQSLVTRIKEMHKKAFTQYKSK